MPSFILGGRIMKPGCLAVSAATVERPKNPAAPRVKALVFRNWRRCVFISEFEISPRSGASAYMVTNLWTKQVVKVFKQNLKDAPAHLLLVVIPRNGNRTRNRQRP